MLLTDDVALHPDTLHAALGVLARGPEPERLLPAILDLVAEATGGHACFVALREGPGLRVRAASPRHAGHVGRHLAAGELRDLAPGPAVVAPLGARDGGEPIGALIVHADEGAREVVVALAGLVAGAIDGARAFEALRAEAERAAAAAELTRAIAEAARREDVVRVARAGLRRLLGADACRVLAPGDPVPDPLAAAEALVAGGAEVGVLVVERRAPLDADERRALALVGDHLAVALQKSELLERLTDEHLVRDVFDALAEGRTATAEARARAAGHDLDQPHVVVVLEPLGEDADPRWPEVAARVEARLRRVAPGALCDPGDERLRALVPVGDADAALEGLDAELDALAREERLAGGRGEPRGGLAEDERALGEAASAARVARALAPAGGARAYGGLGAYRYLAPMPVGHAPDERHARAIAALAAYDARRRTDLLTTLERHLGDRGALAATARTLYIHTNTLRQRLDRIETLTGLDLATEDLLSLELALKLARLNGAA